MFRIIVARGFMGDPASWCFWDEEFPDDDSYGPFVSKEDALIDVKKFCSWEDVAPSVHIDETMSSPRLLRVNSPRNGRVWPGSLTTSAPFARMISVRHEEPSCAEACANQFATVARR
jgi:hypothetical protein